MHLRNESVPAKSEAVIDNRDKQAFNAKTAGDDAFRTQQQHQPPERLPWTTYWNRNMASSASSSLASNTSKPSRISSLKAFKFIAKEKGSKPPPPPPKDPSYTPSRILSPDALSIPPNSPVSPYHHTQFSQRTSPDPSQSSLSLTSSAASGRSQTEEPSYSQRQSRLKVKASSLFTLVKRSGKSAKSPDPERPPSPQDDAGVSTPWNFQVRQYSGY
jgi:hypothetical protein